MTMANGPTYLITGASGIAAACVRHLASKGANLFVISRDENQCIQLGDEIAHETGKYGYCCADLTDSWQTAAAFEAARGAFSNIRGVFAAAGASGRRLGDGPLHEITDNGWEGTFRLNATPTFLTAKNAILTFQHQAAAATPSGRSLLLMSSVLATSPAPELFATHAYAAAKGAVEHLTLSAAAYYVKKGIRINCIAPGFVTTPMSARASNDPDTRRYIEGRQPLADGPMEAVDIAPTVSYLLSTDSAQMTGQILSVDAGWTVT